MKVSHVLVASRSKTPAVRTFQKCIHRCDQRCSDFWRFADPAVSFSNAVEGYERAMESPSSCDSMKVSHVLVACGSKTHEVRTFQKCIADIMLVG